MTGTNFTCSVEDLSAYKLDVLIVGSGPAGVAVAERLYQKNPKVTIGILERGAILTLTHINNIFPNEMRRPFIDRFKIKPWEGTFENGGMLIPALGGRGIAAGAHLRRFDKTDFKLWKNGEWPNKVITDIPKYYTAAELARRVSIGTLRGPAEIWALGILEGLHPYPPPIGVDLWTEGGFQIGQGYDSSVARLWKLLLQDTLANEKRRVYIATNAYVTKIEHEGLLVTGVRCQNMLSKINDRPHFIPAKVVVLAASTVESARLILCSELAAENPTVGCYLAEHIERRAKIMAPIPITDPESEGVSIVIPPEGTDKRDRFQIHLRGRPDRDGNLIIDIGGFAAMDPSEDNRVTLSKNTDSYGVPKAHTKLLLSDDDRQRTDRMCQRMKEITEVLGGKFVTERFPFEDIQPQYIDDERTIQVMEPGRSYHEAGTLRMGIDSSISATNEFGQLHTIANTFAADASVFPSVGIANPMLTITALAYRLADHISERI